MKLLVHNFLSSKFLKGVQTGFPLKLVATQAEVKEVDFNADFIKRMGPKLDWSALRLAASSVDPPIELPDQLPADNAWQEDESLLKRIHHVLLEVDVLEGHVECPETGRQFPIKNGIPNMLARDDEVQ